MATHIVFFGFTQKGIEKIKESPARVQDAKQIVQSLGGKVKDFYGIMGMAGYDTLFVVEAPNDEVIAKAVLMSNWRNHGCVLNRYSSNSGGLGRDAVPERDPTQAFPWPSAFGIS